MLKVFVTTQFEGWHRWKEAPPTHSYLREYHRHMFHVRLEKQVGHADRDIEFISLKQEVTQFLRSRYEGKQFDASCEMIAMVLSIQFAAASVEVSEDGENGAIVTAE